MALIDDIAVDVAANMFNVESNPYAFAATFIPLSGASVPMIINLIVQDVAEINGYDTTIIDEEILIEYSRADLDRDVKDNERFLIGSRNYIVKGIRERDRFPRTAIVK